MLRSALASRTSRRVIIGSVIGVLAAVLLAAVTEDVVNHDPLTQFDLQLLQWLHQHATPVGVAIFSAVSRLGSPVMLTVLAFAGTLALAVVGEWVVLGGWAAAFAGASLIDYWLKLAIHRPRPTYAAAVIHNPSWSFPSGHAMGSLVGYGMLAYVLMLALRGRPAAQRAVAAGAGVLIIAIGISRLYLGVHYFSDVVGGYAAGLLWLSTCVCAVELGRRWERRALRLHPTG